MVQTIERSPASDIPPVGGGLGPDDYATLEAIERRLL